jgi:hypothetical protein
MNCKYSEVPVGKQFKHNGKIYTRFTYNRGKQIVDGKPIFTKFYKHAIVEKV